MNTITKPMSYKRKVMAMYRGEFYLNPKEKNELLSMVEHGMIVTDRAAVEFIDDNGEWLTHDYS